MKALESTSQGTQELVFVFWKTFHKKHCFVLNEKANVIDMFTINFYVQTETLSRCTLSFSFYIFPLILFSIPSPYIHVFTYFFLVCFYHFTSFLFSTLDLIMAKGR